MQPHNEKGIVRVELTREQQAQVKRATGRDSVAVELTVEELEERIAPGVVVLEGEGRLATNHNETFLADR